ncbi:MAG: mycothiol system anti-sigma-R factor [Microthrixaceae bacterium]
MSGDDNTGGIAPPAQPGSGCVETDCADAAEQLQEYLSGELDSEAIGAIEAHIHRCGPCLDAYDFHSALRKVIASKCAESMPGDLRSRLVGMLDQAASNPE